MRSWLVIVVIALASCSPSGSPTTAADLSPTGRSQSRLLEPPPDFSSQVPARWRDYAPEVEEVLTATAVASFVDPEVWAAPPERDAVARVMAPVGEAFDLDDFADTSLEDLRQGQPAGAAVTSYLGSVFPRDAQPLAVPTIYRNHWRVTTRGSVATVSVVVFAGYDVSRDREAGPVVIGRGFSILIDEKDGSAKLTFRSDGLVWLADGCSLVADGLLRRTSRLSQETVEVTRREFADTTPEDPMAALEPMVKVKGMDTFDDADRRKCLQKKS